MNCKELWSEYRGKRDWHFTDYLLSGHPILTLGYYSMSHGINVLTLSPTAYYPILPSQVLSSLFVHTNVPGKSSFKAIITGKCMGKKRFYWKSEEISLSPALTVHRISKHDIKFTLQQEYLNSILQLTRNKFFKKRKIKNTSSLF